MSGYYKKIRTISSTIDLYNTNYYHSEKSKPENFIYTPGNNIFWETNYTYNIEGYNYFTIDPLIKGNIVNNKDTIE